MSIGHTFPDLRDALDGHADADDVVITAGDVRTVLQALDTLEGALCALSLGLRVGRNRCGAAEPSTSQVVILRQAEDALGVTQPPPGDPNDIVHQAVRLAGGALSYLYQHRMSGSAHALPDRATHVPEGGT